MSTQYIDTYSVASSDKISYANIKLSDFDVNNVVLNSNIHKSARTGIEANFSFAYYMINGRPHRFFVDVYGRQGHAIYDLMFKKFENTDRPGEYQKCVILDTKYHTDDIHRSIVTLLLDVYYRVIGIISRTSEFLKLSFGTVGYNSALSRLKAESQKDPKLVAEDFWYNELINLYPEEAFLSKDLFRQEKTIFNGEEMMQKAYTEDGEPVINDQSFGIFMDFYERPERDKNGDIKGLKAVLIDSKRTEFFFDQVEGCTATLAKLTFDVGRLNMRKGRIKIHRGISGGVLLDLELRTTSLDKYLDDVDPSLLKHGPVSIPIPQAVDDGHAEEDEMEDVGHMEELN